MISKPVIIISGPTASGKTSTSLMVAEYLKNHKNLNPVIVNFDSLLFYNELNIGTAKPTKEELSKFEHYMVNICSGKNPINASDYVTDAKKIINDMLAQDKIVVLVGGSGFYLRALVKGMYEGHTTPNSIRDEVEDLYLNNGIESLRNFLKENDFESFNNLHENDHYRIRRAVEFFKSTGQKISLEKIKQDEKDPYNLIENRDTDWNIFNCFLDLPKPEHQSIIEKRTSQMIKEGLIEEVKNLLNSGFDGNEKPINSIGYKETLAYLSGEIQSIEDLIDRIIISTRQLAKAQRTFFKKISPKQQFHPLSDKENILKSIINFLEQ